MSNNTNTMENARDLQVFKNNDLGNVRISKDENSEPWFCLKDICNCLDIKNSTDISNRLDDEVVKVYPIPDAQGVEHILSVFDNETVPQVVEQF